MKKVIPVIITFMFSLNVIAQDSGFGIGVVAGEPTGLTIKS